MGPRSLALMGHLCALMAIAHSLAIPTEDTIVVTKTDKVTPPSASTEVTTEEPLAPLKLKEMQVTSEVSLRYAHTVVVTRMRNPARRAQEATFRVLLPETAFISGFVMTLGDKSYKAYVKEKEEAKQIYNNAVSQGLGAAHIAAKARDSNQFTVSVNVEANTTAVFNLTYEELLIRRNGVYNHAINLHPGTLVPKLTVTVKINEEQKITLLRVPQIRTGNEVDATGDDAQNTKAVIERGHDDRVATVTFTPTLDEQKELMQVYKDKSKESANRSSRFYDKVDEPEGVLGQFVVQYDVDRPSGGEILVNDGYFVHFFAPPGLKPLNKHVVFVLDTSGSMYDRKIVQLREAMQSILSDLNEGDYFNIVEFDSRVKVHNLSSADEEVPKKTYSFYDPKPSPTELVPPSPATPDNIAKAKVIVSRLSADGGTDIDEALSVAVELIHKGIGWTPVSSNVPSNASTTVEPKTLEVTPVTEAPVAVKNNDANDLEPIIIFLTDGEPTVGVTDLKQIINRLAEKNYGDKKATIFSLAFGEEADRDFLRKVSLRNSGFMRHIYESGDAALQLRDFYRQVASPLLADVKFTYPKDQVKEDSLTKHRFRTYYGGSETVVAGRVEPGTDLAAQVDAWCAVSDAGSKGKKKYEIFPKVPVARPRTQYLPLERLWAYLTIQQLLDAKDTVDADPEAKDKENSPEKKALKIALQYEFVTPLTSLVVVKPNDTNAVNAESVDSQNGASRPFALSGAAFGLSGPPGYPSAAGAPINAFYSSRSGFTHSRGHSHSYHSFGPSHSPYSSYSQIRGGSSNRIYGGYSGSHRYPSAWSATSSTMSLSNALTTPYLPMGTLPPPSNKGPFIIGGSPLAVYHLQEFTWLTGLLNSTTDSISLVANTTNVSLKLVRGDVAPKSTGKDEECPHATDGAAGVCVYLTRCAVAKLISEAIYTGTYCAVNNEYAGVCCPTAEVDKTN